MPQTAQINLRVDKSVKRDAEEVCSALGLSLSTAINIYLKKLGRERRIPFELNIAPDPFYSPQNMAHLRRSITPETTGETVHEVNLSD